MLCSHNSSTAKAGKEEKHEGYAKKATLALERRHRRCRVHPIFITRCA